MSHERYINALVHAGIQYRQLDHEPMGSIEEVKRHMPSLLPTMVKAVAFMIKDGPIVLVAACGADRIDYKRVAAHFGIGRRQLRSLSSEQVLSELGVRPGEVAPIPLSDNQILIIDTKVMALKAAHIGSGRLDRTFELSPADLVGLSNEPILAVTK